MHPVIKTILERIALGIATLFVVSLVIFSAIELLPGDFSQVILGQSATQANMAAISKELGLDQPPHLRYLQWIAGAVQGDLGTSFSGRNASGVDRSREVVDLIAPRLSNTLFLASMTAIIAVPISLVLGVTSALYRNSFYDRSVNTATLTTISFPEFFVAYILILTLSSLWPIFPSLANVDGYQVGGKTGTAQTSIVGGYSNKKINTFASVFPSSNPKYVFIVMLDEPKTNSEYIYNYRDGSGIKYKGTPFNTAGWTSVEVVGQIIEKIGPILATKYNEVY